MMLLAFAVTSCEKEETPEPQQQTLEQLYPDLANLTWLKTLSLDGTTEYQYPRISIKIVGNVATLTDQGGIEEKVIYYTYKKVKINGNQITFIDDESNTRVCTFEKVNGTIIFNDEAYHDVRFVLKIN